MIVYIVGPLFSEAEENQRRKEGVLVREALQQLNLDATVINPIDMPFNDKPVSSDVIFTGDYAYQCQADAVFLDLCNPDPGSHMALGILLEKKLSGQAVELYPVISDSRLSRNSASGLECPVGFNAFVTGAFKANHIPVFSTFNEALSQFIKDFHK